MMVWRTATAIWRNERTHRTMPWLVSLTLHAALIVSAAFIVWRIRDAQTDAPPMVVSFEEPTIAPAMMTPPADEPEPDPTEALDRILAQPVEATPVEAPALPSLPEPPPIITPDVETFEPPTVDASQGLEVQFSGLGASDARDIVYVVDASGSMITSLPDVFTELRRSIARLHPMQRFQVFLIQSPRDNATGEPGFIYTTVPSGLRKPVLIDGTRANKQAVFEWLETIGANRASNIIPALEAALKLRPDAVFLLSSGATDPALLGMSPDAALSRLDQLNPRRSSGDRSVVIRTIQVLEEDPLSLLRRIAAAHGGESGYKFISRDEITRRFSQDGD
jgi:hypothetical protein